MQFLPPLTSDPKVIAREKAAGEHLPYAAHLNPNTLRTRDGFLIAAMFWTVLGLFGRAARDAIQRWHDVEDRGGCAASAAP